MSWSMSWSGSNSPFPTFALYSGDDVETRELVRVHHVARRKDSMTEIPEHLLKRSKERRAALGGGSDAGEASPATSPATVGASTPATAPKPPAPARVPPTPPPPPKPDPAYVVAAKIRKKVPFWAMATLSLLPIWGFMYVQGVKPQAKVVHGPIGDGKQVYSSCASCHNADGSGGVGRPFVNGAVLKTFPHIEDQLNLVYTGSKAYKDTNIGPYGDPAVGHLGYNGAFMPAQGTGLSQAQILAVVCHERYDLGGADPASPKYSAEYTKWCAADSAIYAGLKDGSLNFDNLATKVKGTLEIGIKPRKGTPAGATS